MKAQGEHRGPKPDAEEHYTGDGAAMAATTAQAARTVAFKAYRDELAARGLHEVWTGGQLSYRDGVTSQPVDVPGLAGRRRDALGYGDSHEHSWASIRRAHDAGDPQLCTLCGSRRMVD